MTRVTVVIEDHAEGIHLGQQLAGGRVVAAMQGDHSDLRRDAERYRTWRDAACYRVIESAKALTPCITPEQIDEAIDKLT